MKIIFLMWAIKSYIQNYEYLEGILTSAKNGSDDTGRHFVQNKSAKSHLEKACR